MSSNGNQAVVARFWQEAFGTRNVDLVDELTSPRFMLHHLSNGREFDSVELKYLIDAIHDSIPGFGASVGEQFTAGRNRVVAELTFRAPAPNGEDGEILEFSGIAICRFSGGKLTNVRLLWESLRAEEELRPTRPTYTPPVPRFWKWPPWG
jgi:hypothetical protein